MTSCTQCGTLLPADAPHGLCARCLLSEAMKNQTPPPVDPPPVDPMETRPAAASGSGVTTASLIDIADAAEVARRLPQFEILELLGRGGMGVVYKARQIQLDRIVAIKILPPADAASPGFVERFRREARSLAKLSHPNIVHLYESAQTNGLYYFVMEFVDGLNLRQMILAHRLTASEALAVVPKICDALQFAHEEGVVHRDIKPENILIDKKGRVKIADFGLAKLLGREDLDPRLTVSGATLGTPRYMAPEQVDKPESVDHRADIYSLGVVFYEMLTGELPMGRFAPPSHKVRIDVRLDEIVLHALERDVELRYQHASEVRDAVEEVMSKPAVAPVGSSAAPTLPVAPATVVAGRPDDSKASSVIALLVALGVAWLGLYVFDLNVRVGDALLLILIHLLIPVAAVVAAAWMSIRHRPVSPSPALSMSLPLRQRVPGAWLALLQVHSPLLLGIHLLIFSAMLFGTRVVKPADSHSWFSDWYAVGLLHSDWGTEFWIGPFAVAVACAALVILLITAVSSRWALWRGDIVLFAGLLTGCALLIFHAQWSFGHVEHSVPNNAIRVTVAGATWVTREHQRGMLDWFCVVLLIVGGSVTMKLVLAQPSGPRLSHLAVWVLVLPSLCISTSLLFAYPIAMPILGAIATWQIKRSNGKLRGLRLAALEAILVPLFLFAALVGHAVFWPILCLVTMLISPHQFSFLNTMDMPAIVIPMALFAIGAALIAAFFTGRVVWRKIVGQPAARLGAIRQTAPKPCRALRRNGAAAGSHLCGRPRLDWDDFPGGSRHCADGSSVPSQYAFRRDADARCSVGDNDCDDDLRHHRDPADQTVRRKTLRPAAGGRGCAAAADDSAPCADRIPRLRTPRQASRF